MRIGAKIGEESVSGAMPFLYMLTTATSRPRVSHQRRE